MSRYDFLRSVRTAVGTLEPPGDTAHPSNDREELEGRLRQSNLWLARSAVAGFDREDFPDLDPKTLERLDRSVSRFQEVAATVDPKRPPTRDQVEDAIPPFVKVALIVREVTLEEWLQAARALTNEAEAWAQAKGWPTRRYDWTLSDPLLGQYHLDRLIYGVTGSQLALIPRSPYSFKSIGSFELAVMPAYDSVTVSRRPSGTWVIAPLPGENASHTWKRPQFVRASEALAKMG